MAMLISGTLTDPGVVVKVDVNPGRSFSRVTAVTLPSEEHDLSEAVMDLANGYAYFSTYTEPGIRNQVGCEPGPLFRPRKCRYHG